MKNTVMMPDNSTKTNSKEVIDVDNNLRFHNCDDTNQHHQSSTTEPMHYSTSINTMTTTCTTMDNNPDEQEMMIGDEYNNYGDRTSSHLLLRHRARQRQQNQPGQLFNPTADSTNHLKRSNNNNQSNDIRLNVDSNNLRTDYFYYNKLVTILSLITMLIGLIIFTSSFFLAKRTLIDTSSCYESIQLLLQEPFYFTNDEIRQLIVSKTIVNSSNNNGCWMERKVDSLIIVVVDALRFDFAYYNLPKSIGKRISLLNDNNQQQQLSYHNHTASNNTAQGTKSRLYQFVADPPTVTTQRLKALTTGGLPTFADISSNFGGASVMEDTWLHQLRASNNYRSRGLDHPSKIAFVGDDTWVDLFTKDLFTVCYPYPSFNTRDLNTVDDGCIQHIPDFINNIRHKKNTTTANVNSNTSKVKYDNDNNKNDEDSNNHSTTKEVLIDDGYEVVIVHFLGVDHVGHTYGPHNEYMDAKLKQMDDTLSNILDRTDQDTSTCHAVFILGDHGMTPDGNHGGGTVEEINAALFVHTSMGCQPLLDSSSTLEQQQSSSSTASKTRSIQNSLPSDWNVPNPEQFLAIHQIDLVPTISIMLGLPIPYGNLGSIVPSIIPGIGVDASRISSSRKNSFNSNPRYMVTALALNSAQVWRYYTHYSTAANKLPNLHKLQNTLNMAVSAWKDAIRFDIDNNKNNDINNPAKEHDIQQDDDSTRRMADSAADKYMESASLFKLFLAEALDLGHAVWTRFDTVGMIAGIIVLSIGLLLYSIPFFVFLPSPSMLLFLLSWVTKKDDKKNDEQKTLMKYVPPLQLPQLLEHFVTLVIIVFQFGMLTFSNSYILEEDHSIMYGICIISFLVAFRVFSLERWARKSNRSQQKQQQPPKVLQPMAVDARVNDKFLGFIPLWIGLLILPVCSRIHELFVSGHGLDPSIRNVHPAHDEFVFLSSVILLIVIRWSLYLSEHTEQSLIQASCDCMALFFLSLSWLDKRSVDPNRNGYMFCQICISFLTLGITSLAVSSAVGRNSPWRTKHNKSDDHFQTMQWRSLTICIKILIAIMVFTGPATAISMVLYSIQTFILYKLTATKFALVEKTAAAATTNSTTNSQGTRIEMPIGTPIIIATLWKLVTRHMFFSTNHGFFFNRLQYSSAFVAQHEFSFFTGGIALAINTFGWDVAGFFVICMYGQCYQKMQQSPSPKLVSGRQSNSWTDNVILRIYCFFQFLEALCSCISVSVLRRHLMVWDIYAPHFLFTTCFTVLNLIFLIVLVISD